MQMRNIPLKRLASLPLLLLLLLLLLAFASSAALGLRPPHAFHVFEHVPTANEPPVQGFGAHEAAAIGTVIYGFGGVHENRSIFWLDGDSFTKFYNDLWTFDTVTREYALVEPVDGVKPPVRTWFSMASDNVDKLFVFGGLGPGYANRGDLWVYSKTLNKWTDMTPPAAITNTAGIDDSTADIAAEPRKFHRSLLQQNQQQQMTAETSVYPPPLNGPAMVYDDGVLFIFGGMRQNFVTSNNHIYRYVIDSGEWSTVDPVYEMEPVPLGRTLPEFKLRIDGRGRKHLVMYGGELFNATIGYFNYVDDMWSFDLTDRIWTQLIALNDPAALARRLHFASVYEPTLDQWHFHGGDYGDCRDTDLISEYTMVYDFKSGKFVDDLYGTGLLAGQRGPPSKRGKFTRLAANGQVYLTGGFYSTQPGNTDQTYPDEIYRYYPVNTKSRLVGTPAVRPGPIPPQMLCPDED